ncbi:metaxin-1 [Euwallacea fornicatus]|uniref:metaxin-1 n=1 Tax=Euwallacea fornicatus TaxID=995702 RepID=UPI00338F59F7
MIANDKFTLYIYDGDYGLPSLDVECTKTLLFFSIAKIPLQIITFNNLKVCIFHSGSYFVHKNVCLKSFHESVLYLNTLNYNLDVNLSPKQQSESLALKTLVQAKLRPALEYVFWLDQRNCEEFTQLWYAKALPFPFNNIHIKRLKDNALDLIESQYPCDCSLETAKDNITMLVTECLTSLSARLSNLNYFYGDNPTSLDIIVYSYLAPLLKLPFPSNSINSLVTLWPNLVNYIKRIDVKYLPDLPKEPKYIRNEDKAKTSDDDVSYVAISILTISAVTLMFGFAISKGFISTKLY